MTDRIDPWTDVTFVGVYWNDPDRVYELLQHVRPWFANMVVGVQADDPETDPTFDRARRIADLVISDKVHGHCEPTIPKVLAEVKTEWAFLVSADEWPTTELLGSFQRMLDAAQTGSHDGFWIHMLSSIEGVEYPSEQDNHLRVFKTRLGWPTTLHSRPPASHPMFWNPAEYLRHDRSLDEMMVDYLRYFKIGASDMGWINHNKLMMHDACDATAKKYGWNFVKAFEWWPQVRDIAFDGEEQSGFEPEPAPEPEPSFEPEPVFVAEPIIPSQPKKKAVRKTGKAARKPTRK